jgi:hypothetical protein
MLVGKDTNDEIKTPFAGMAKRRNSLSQCTHLEARRECCYGSPLTAGCFEPKPADRLVTGQAQALEHCKF